ncbi:MAG: DUF2142 domain-containing protein [Faecalibacterium sp.]|jgi:hypothetical protein|nr:DUF2142 domain-containing protein [Faecalibacterium sp.]
MSENAAPKPIFSRRAALLAGGFLAVEALAAALVYFWRVFYYLDARGIAWLPLTAAVCGIAAALYAAAALTVRFAKGFAARAAVCVFLCGLLFVFVNPPLQVPDETLHFLRAYSISEGHFDFDAARAYPEDVSRLAAAFPGAWVNAHTSQGMRAAENGETEVYDSTGYALKQYGESGAVGGIADGFTRYFSGQAAEKEATEPLSFVILPYLASAAGMALSHLFGLGALGALYGGRIANLAVYALLCWLTLRGLKRYKPLFLAVMLLPMSLYMAASCNYDAILLGCYWLLASYFFREALDDAALWQYLAVFLITNTIKPWINLLWLAALWCIPKAGWRAKLKRWQLALLCLVPAVLISRFVDWYGIAFRVHYPEIGRTIEGADQLPQLKFILSNPLRYAAVLLGTLYENRFFIGQLGVFGALDLPIEVLNVTGPAMLAAGAAISAPRPETAQRLRVSAAVGGWAVVYAAAAMTAMYITYTPVGMVRVIGLQARYFLPAFLLLGTVLAAALGRALAPQKDLRKAQGCAFWLFGLYAVGGALLLWQHYFIGPVYTI